LNHTISYKKKIQGFTLIEQIIVLALSGLVALISFAAFMNFQRLIVKVQASSAIDRSIYHLHSVLENDFRNSSKITWDGQLHISKISQTVRYDFGDQYLIRESSESIDTFRFDVKDLSYTGLGGKDLFIESLSFEIIGNDQHYKMEFIKEYPEYIKWGLNNYGH
jgi:prepilin-type N-terminal cleavage/methylation domain-containing protein